MSKAVRIQDFKHWDKVVDYESDAFEVVLYGKNKKKLATFDYPGFTAESLDHFKKQSTKK